MWRRTLAEELYQVTFCQSSHFLWGRNKSESLTEMVVRQSCDILITHLAVWFWEIYRCWNQLVSFKKNTRKMLQNRWKRSRNVTVMETWPKPIRLKFWGLEKWIRCSNNYQLYYICVGRRMLIRGHSFSWTTDKHKLWAKQKHQTKS